MCLVSLSSDSEEEEKTPNVRAVKKRKIGSKLKYASKVQQVGKGVQETIDISSNDEGSKKDAFGDDSDVEIIDDDRVVENLRHLCWRGATTTRIRITKTLPRHEIVAVRAQPKTKTHAYPASVKDDAHARLAGRARRQRRPAAVIV